jgi:hypothetical protein
MAKTIFHDGDDGVELIVSEQKDDTATHFPTRQPVHVVYGGADRFDASTAAKLGTIALQTLETHFGDLSDFARCFAFSGSESRHSDFSDKKSDFSDKSRLASEVYKRTKAKLEREPIEDFRIDFEDGYGFRQDEEEDAHAKESARALATTFEGRSITAFCGIRIKSVVGSSSGRAIRTLELFLEQLLQSTNGRLPENFVVTIPKVTSRKEIKNVISWLKVYEERFDLPPIGIEVMIETPEALYDEKGRVALPALIRSAKGRCTSAHFGAYDYTSLLGIAGEYQSIGHPACDAARQLMLATLAPLGIRLSDSVTTAMPIGAFKGSEITPEEFQENSRNIRSALKEHFDNVTRSMSQGFYQSWDLHPNQLIGRYAAVYSFFLKSMSVQSDRLRSFIKARSQAAMTGNTFDDAASAHGIVNFFKRGIDCGAFSEDEVTQATGLSYAELCRPFSEFAEQLGSPHE